MPADNKQIILIKKLLQDSKTFNLIHATILNHAWYHFSFRFQKIISLISFVFIKIIIMDQNLIDFLFDVRNWMLIVVSPSNSMIVISVQSLKNIGTTGNQMTKPHP